MTKDEVTRLVNELSGILPYMDYNSCGPDTDYVILYGTKERRIIPEEHSKGDIIELCKLCDEELYHSSVYQKIKIKFAYPPEDQPKHENIKKKVKVDKKNYPIPLLSEEEVARREEMHEKYCVEKVFRILHLILVIIVRWKYLIIMKFVKEFFLLEGKETNLLPAVRTATARSAINY